MPALSVEDQGAILTVHCGVITCPPRPDTVFPGYGASGELVGDRHGIGSFLIIVVKELAAGSNDPGRGVQIEGVVKTMMLSPLKKVTAGLIILTAGLAGAGLVMHKVLAETLAQENADPKPPEQGAQQSPTKTTAAKPAAPARADEQDATKTVTFAGQVVDPDGKPVENAKVYVATDLRKDSPMSLPVTTGDDGRYRFSVRKAEFNTTYTAEPWKDAWVFARAEGYGLGLPQHSREKPFQGGDMTIKLAKD
jgi:hypothetical protein